MEWIAYAFQTIYQIASIPINLFGFVITLWNIIMFSMFAGLVIWFLINVFDN